MSAPPRPRGSGGSLPVRLQSWLGQRGPWDLGTRVTWKLEAQGSHRPPELTGEGPGPGGHFTGDGHFRALPTADGRVFNPPLRGPPPLGRGRSDAQRPCDAGVVGGQVSERPRWLRPLPPAGLPARPGCAPAQAGTPEAAGKASRVDWLRLPQSRADWPGLSPAPESPAGHPHPRPRAGQTRPAPPRRCGCRVKVAPSRPTSCRKLWAPWEEMKAGPTDGCKPLTWPHWCNGESYIGH